MKTRARLLISVAAGTVLLAGCAEDSPIPSLTAPEVASTEVSTLLVEPVESPSFYEATGTLKAQFNATLSSKVMAHVRGVHAREGDEVRRGQVLVSLDARELAAGVDVARANLNASHAGVGSATAAREIEARTSAARIAQAQAALAQAKAAANAAQSRLDLALAGPRSQEKAQARLAVIQAESSLKLAKTHLDRVSSLVSQGAMAKKELEVAQNAYDLALAQRDTALEAEKIAEEGTRAEEIRAAREGVSQAQAAIRQAEANVTAAKAAALQTKVRAEDVRAAQAHVRQSQAALRSAGVSLAYATLTAPFDGRVVLRSADPGAMALPGSALLAVEGGELRLEAMVPESVLSHVRKGQTVRIGVDALNREYVGTVVEIVPQGDAKSRTFTVKATLFEPGEARSGMFGRAYFETGRKRTLQIPAEATWAQEGMHYVFVVNPEGIARLRIVTLGEGTDGQVEVLSGLKAGERIVREGRESVKDGMKVANP